MKIIRIAITSLLFFLITSPTKAQLLKTFNTEWNNDFTSWTITFGEDQEGNIRMRWPLNKDWTDWNVTLGDVTGRLKLKWNDNPEYWEFSTPGGLIIDIRTTWRGNTQSWIIQQGRKRFELRTVYGNSLEAWETPTDKLGYFGLYTTYEGDLESWTIVDEMKETEIVLETKVVAAFISILHSVPKN